MLGWSGIGAAQVAAKFCLEKTNYAVGEPIFLLQAFANLTQVRFEVCFSRLLQILLLEIRDLLDDGFVHVVLICHAAIVIGSYRKEDLRRETIRGQTGRSSPRALPRGFSHHAA